MDISQAAVGDRIVGPSGLVYTVVGVEAKHVLAKQNVYTHNDGFRTYRFDWVALAGFRCYGEVVDDLG